MAEILEDHKSREVELNSNGGSATYMYTLKGYADEDAAMTAMLNYAPSTVTVGGLALITESSRINPIVIGDDANTTIFKGVMRYGSPELTNLTTPQADENALLSGEFTARTSDILFAKDSIHVEWDESSKNWREYEPISVQPPTAAVQWIGNAINKYSKYRPVLGTQRNIPASTFSLTTIVPPEVATNDWFKSRMNQVWTLNATTFRSLPPRTVALTNMGYQQRADGSWEVTYSFEYRPYVESYRISRRSAGAGDVPFASTNVNGELYNGTSGVQGTFRFCAWDYLWIRDVEGVGTQAELQIDGFSISVLYDSTNFFNLGV